MIDYSAALFDALSTEKERLLIALPDASDARADRIREEIEACDRLLRRLTARVVAAILPPRSSPFNA